MTPVLSVHDLKKFELPNPDVSGPVSASAIYAKQAFPPQQLILLFSADAWEEFILEWAHYQKNKYVLVAGLGGANDYGIDVAAFRSDKGFLGSWDNYQCKHYDKPLGPSAAYTEIGKLIWHIFNKRITTPDTYFFFSPKDCGPALKKLLLDSSKLKSNLLENWDKSCEKNITSKESIKLEGDFLEFVNQFNFDIFKYKPHLDILDEHRATPYHAARFGGGLCERPKSELPPVNPASPESRYVQQLLEAYSDCGEKVISHEEVVRFPTFESHFNRSRQVFYEAESLTKFARDTVPNGTFESLQDEVFLGVKDVEEDDHDTAFKRVKEVTKTASGLNVSGNGLSGVITSKDLQGICHQLANEDKLTWRKK